ncbi:hypothetical protein BRPE64_BCDS07290 [Caballeronia insecticola]|uniref:Uncharacterized protein n=1 Tax=Caballeronia insecticola TaxID=758793 RepID=R4WWC0_9BURK|nr:hypothetical protein BRPE64_BCDS07290 [Caballeronia insecticola]
MSGFQPVASARLFVSKRCGALFPNLIEMTYDGVPKAS